MARQLALFLEHALTDPQPTRPRRTPRSVGPAERADFCLRLERLLRARIATLRLTDNRVTIFSIKARPDGHFDMRIHAGFVDAPLSVLEDVVICYTVTGRTARTRRRRQQSLARVRSFFDGLDDSSLRPRRRAPLVSLGAVWDLEPIYREINDLYFQGRVVAEITWGQGRRSTVRRRRSYTIQLGSYVYEDRRIRIHPILDRDEVPRMVVEAVMHHEMVHAHLGLEGCTRTHGPEFQALESRFARLAQADAWLDANLTGLIAHEEGRRSG